MKQALCIAGGVLVGAMSARGQESVHNGYAVAPFFRAAATERVDVVCLGDSNQLHFGGGWDRAWTRVLQSRLGLYASGVITPGEGSGNGGGIGEGWGVVGVGQGAFQTTGAPQPVARYLDGVTSGLGPLSYIYVPEGSSVSGSAQNGLVFYIIAPVTVTEPLRFHYATATFGGAGPGAFRPIIRDDASPFPILLEGPRVSTRAGPVGSVGVDYGFIELPADIRPQQISFRFAPVVETIDGPFAAFGMRAEQVTATRGASLHTLFGVGGKSARDMAAALIASDDATLTVYFEQVRRLGSRGVLIRVNTGVNDRNEELASMGPLGVTPGWSAEAYADNLDAIVSRLREIWSLNGWDRSELFFLFTPSHPVSAPDQQLLRDYRQAARGVSDRVGRSAVVDFDALVGSEAMVRNWWYYGGSDVHHLSGNGLDALSAREVDALRAAARCAADVDGSGGIDGDDIVWFFGRWDANQMDYNGDGGTDSDDVIPFFLDWDAGCEA
ncbi:MAG: SGNH/GDSL hydrolase family protein [Phycisphaerales bacterium]